MQLRKLVCVLALSIGAAMPAFAESNAEPIVVPSEVCGDYFFIPITLASREGYPADRTLWFLYDTGASISTIDPHSIERVSGKRSNSVSGPVLATLQPGL